MIGQTRLSRGEHVEPLPQKAEAEKRKDPRELGLAALVERTVAAEEALKKVRRQLGYTRDTLARQEAEEKAALEEYDAVREAIREAVSE